MASKDLKTLLKNARDCIKNKDYKEAIKHCKAVLKVDKTNYNGLVFFGKCASELGQPEQALMVYKKATEVDDSQMLAWQGIAALCEKEDILLFKAELPQTYTRLLQFFESDRPKRKETAMKLARILEKQEEMYLQAVERWEDIAFETENQDEQFGIWARIIKILEKLKETYERVVHGIWSQDHKNQLEIYFEDYIRLLKKYEGSGDKASQKQKIYEEGKLMTKLFPNSNFALELQAATFLESLTAAPSPEMSDVFQRLCHLYPSSPVGRIGLGCILFHLKEFLAAREILQQGLEVFTECPSGWLWLCKSQISLHDYQNAEKTARKGLNCTNVATETAGKELQKMLSLSRAEALQKQGQPTAATALKIYEQVAVSVRFFACRHLLLHVFVKSAANIIVKLLTGSESSEELCVLTGLGNVLLMLGDTEQATQICKKALLIDKTCHAALALQGQISFQEGYFDDAELRLLEAIERQQDCAFYHFLLGKLYWEMNGNLRADKKKCLAQFLKAAKLDPYYSTSFLYLGHYHYQVLKDVRKASRCYQKAFDLDSSCDNAGIALGDSLMELGDQIAALNLYKNVTAMSSPGKGKWAWLRLGLYHLKQNESTEAVTCLQSALRADPQDRHCWECLGEAYMSRGSFMAAMKAFTKATELDPSSLYCLYQLAAIKQLLSVHADAIEEYKHILQLQHDYVPALKGLGETYLNLARSALEEDFNGRAVDHVMQALHVLARGVECRPDLCCLWKLIGDCCTVIHPVSSCSISGRIPDNLTKCIPGEAGSGDVEKRHILALGSSAYSRALKLQPECGSLWGDLGLSCFQQTKILIGDEKQKMAKRAVQALKKSLTLQPANHKLWNILGVITASKEINNPGLSQHSFIMSIKTEPNNVVAWTNLGVLYLKHSKIELAHEAFKNAQALDPSYTAAWIGQASIAEIIGSEETIDLFRHTVELGSHVEGNIGYARWVCSSLLPDKSRDNRVVQEGKPVPNLSHLHAEYRKSVLQSACALSKYTDRIRNNAGAFNMLGILLEHQNLFLQAETAFASAIKLIQENQSEQCQQQQHLNVVLINHARVLCSLGRYKDAVTQYQAVKLLNEFNDLCGIGLSLFMSGQLKKSYQVYEQALQLAETDADKSCVLAAMGMLGYASNDRENARTLLLKSSQLQPACEQGLMALCALGLVSADAILAGAALGELMKRQTVSEELSANICFLFSRFYALQGDPTVGRSHIMKAVHRNPASGVLWSQLASYLLQACHDELEAAARCAEASARLGRSRSTERNLALHPAGLVGSGAFPEQVTKETQSNAMSRTRAGLVASQKAVHAHPDHVTSWAVLAAAVAAQDVSTTCEGLVRGMRSLGPRLSLFVDTTAAHEKDTLQSQPQHQLPGLVRGRTSHLDTIQSWALVHCGYCLLQTGRLQEALRHVDHALSMYNTIPQISTELHFLKAQISLASGDPLEVGLNMVQTSVLSRAAHLPNAWQVLAQVQANQGSPMAAELCYRQCLQAGIDNRGRCWRAVPLIRIAMLAVLLAQKKSTDRDRWINLSMEASNEVLKLSSNSAVAMLVQGITHFLQDNMRSSRRALQQVLESRTGASELARYWLFLLYLKKNEMSAVEQILSEVKCNNSKRLDLFFYQLAKNGSFSPLEKKRFLERCVLVNPSERSYWDLLKEYRC